jgi:hypothetical protein
LRGKLSRTFYTLELVFTHLIIYDTQSEITYLRILPDAFSDFFPNSYRCSELVFLSEKGILVSVNITVVLHLSLRLALFCRHKFSHQRQKQNDDCCYCWCNLLHEYKVLQHFQILSLRYTELTQNLFIHLYL